MENKEIKLFLELVASGTMKKAEIESQATDLLNRFFEDEIKEKFKYTPSALLDTTSRTEFISSISHNKELQRFVEENFNRLEFIMNVVEQMLKNE